MKFQIFHSVERHFIHSLISSCSDHRSALCYSSLSQSFNLFDLWQDAQSDCIKKSLKTFENGLRARMFIVIYQN